MRVRVIAAAVLGALLAPAAAHAQKPFFDIRRDAAPQIRSVRPLTGPARSDRVSHALAYARAHAGGLGLTAGRVDALGAPQRHEVAGIEQLRWPRSYHGIPAFDDELQVALGANGAVLSASGAPSPAAPASLTPSLSAAQAMAVASDDAGSTAPPRLLTGPRGPRRTTTFAGGGSAQLVVFGSRLAWRVAFPASPAAVYDTVVDATSGAILRRVNLVKSDAPAKVWNDHPDGSPAIAVDLQALGYLSAGATSLQNDWMRGFADANGNDTRDAGEEVSLAGMPFGFTPFGDCGDTTPCTWDPADATSWKRNREQVAVQAFYLANRFRAYLAAPPIGFDGFGHSVPPLNVETDFGADFADPLDSDPDYFDNSGMLLGNSVVPWAMELSLFGAHFSDGDHGFRAMDAGDDASIVDHEYTHGFTNQTVTAGGAPALFSPQAYAIDEASADFFAKSYLVDNRFEDDSATPGEVRMGDYTDVTPNSIRKEALDCPVGTSTSICPGGGYTYADFGRVDARGPEPHYDGEIWSETMWDLRGALGAQRTTQLAAQALAIVAPEPSFLDMRDAILTADAADHYDDATTIWQVFARRGMGCNASTTSGGDVHPVPGFNVPPCSVAGPTPTPQPTVSPAPTSTPAPPPPPRPSFVLNRSGRRGVAFTVTCRAACSVSGTLEVSRSVARRLRLGSTRTVGKLQVKLHVAGRRTFTVHLSAKAARALRRARRLKSFRATLTARAGYPGGVAASRHRAVTVKR